MKSDDIETNTGGEGAIPYLTDAEARKHEEQIGLDTRVVHAVNYECLQEKKC